MAPPAPRKPVPKDHFAKLFTACKTQTYYDPSSRGLGSHASVTSSLPKASSLSSPKKKPASTNVYSAHPEPSLSHLNSALIQSSIRTISWNPTGHLIATGSQDKTLRIWNPEKPQVKNSTELGGHTGAIERVLWNPVKESELASVSADGTAKFWDVRSKQCVHTVQMGDQGWSISWSEDGSMVLLARRVIIFHFTPPLSLSIFIYFLSYLILKPNALEQDDTLIPLSLPHFQAHTHIPQTVQTNQTIFAPVLPSQESHTLFLAQGTGNVKIASYPTNPTPESTLTTLHTLQAHTSSCTSVQYSPNGRYLATGGSDALISLFETTDWTCRHTLDNPLGTVKELSFSWDGSYITCAAEETSEVEIAHVESGEYVSSITTNAPATSVAWHPSRYWVAYAGDPGGLKIHGAAGGPM